MYVDMDSGTVLNGPIMEVPNGIFGDDLLDSLSDTDIRIVAEIVGTLIGGLVTKTHEISDEHDDDKSSGIVRLCVWPTSGSKKYEQVNEIAISFLASCGYQSNDLDKAGDKAGDELQAHLMDVMFRSESILHLFDRVSDMLGAVATRTYADARRDAAEQAGSISSVVAVPPPEMLQKLAGRDKKNFPNFPIT